MQATNTPELLKATAKTARLRFKELESFNPGRHPSHNGAEALEYAAELHGVDHHGVEGFCDQRNGRHGVEYLNMGDAYDATVLFYSDSSTFRVGNWGQTVEAHPSWYV